MRTRIKLLLLVAVGVVFSAGTAWADDPLLFAKPEQAVETLENAVTQPNLELFRQLFGADIDKLVSVNPEVRNAMMTKLSKLFDEGWSLSDVESGHRVIRIGQEGWAFPVPLVRGTAGWHFDTEAGIEEIANRTVGRNELLAIRAMRILSDAQEAYRLKDFDGDGNKGYAGKIISDPGTKNGLYWAETRDDVSPLQLLLRDSFEFAQAANENGVWNGYNFKIGGGGDRYILIAWPDKYGETGVMSFFLTSTDGLYEADLGSDGVPTGWEDISVKGEDWTLVDGGY